MVCPSKPGDSHSLPGRTGGGHEMDHGRPQTLAQDRFGTSPLGPEAISVFGHLSRTRTRTGNHRCSPRTAPPGLLEVTLPFTPIATGTDPVMPHPLSSSRDLIDGRAIIDLLDLSPRLLGTVVPQRQNWPTSTTIATQRACSAERPRNIDHTFSRAISLIKSTTYHPTRQILHRPHAPIQSR